MKIKDGIWKRGHMIRNGSELIRNEMEKPRKDWTRNTRQMKWNSNELKRIREEKI